jgi:CRISPR-associated protein Cmr2
MYRDRDGKTGINANWGHIYNDWQTLKDRHAVELTYRNQDFVSSTVAEALFDLYFQDKASEFNSQDTWDKLISSTESKREIGIMNWMNELILVGWQLCRNSEV